MQRDPTRAVAVRRLLLSITLACMPLIAAAAEGADTLDIASFRGKVVLVDFWASWCVPCRHSFPWLNAMQAKYAERGLVVIGVNVDRERAEAARFLQEVPAEFRIVYDPNGTLASRYDLPGMPVSYVIGPRGDIVGRHVGFRNALRAEREAELQKLLETTQ
jgi:cytochrome c biogenesis protein CcmG, thiol:disulfide interchange protein DsbE